MKKVKIFTWSYCPFCVEAKDILKDKNIEFEEVVIDRDQKALDELEDKTNCSTVPQIFVEDEFIGGCDYLKDLISNSEFEKVFK